MSVGTYTNTTINLSDRVILNAVSNNNLDFEGNSGANVNITGLETIELNGSTSGAITLEAAAITTDYTITWPDAQSVGTQVLSNDGTGALSWTTLTISAGGSDTEVQYNNGGTLDGISGITTNGTTTMNFADNSIASFGTGNDLTITHDTTNSLITNNTGDLIVDNTNVTGSTIVRLGTSDSATTYEIQNNSASTLFSINGFGQAVFPLGTVVVGTFPNSFTLSHNGTTGLLSNSTGRFQIQVSGPNNIISRLGTSLSSSSFIIQDASSTTLFSMDGAGDGNIPDNGTLSFGTGNDLTLTHNATNSSITNITGNLNITTSTSDLILDNTNVTGSIINRLGTDTLATTFEVQNNSASALFTVQGGGNAIIPSTGSLIFGVNDLLVFRSTDSEIVNFTTGDLILENKSTTGSVVALLGTDDSDTSFEVQNLSTNPVISANGAGGFNYDQVIYVDEKGSGVEGGTFTLGAWRARDLNTERYSRQTTTWAALTVGPPSQITIQPGEYYVTASAPAFLVSRHQTRLSDVTGGSPGTTLLEGTSEFADNANNVSNRSFVEGRIVITVVNTLIQLQHQSVTTKTVNGFGVGASFGIDNTYSMIRIVKLN